VCVCVELISKHWSFWNASFHPCCSLPALFRVTVPHKEIGPTTTGHPILKWFGLNAISLFFSSTVLVQQFRGVKDDPPVLGTAVCRAGWVWRGCCRGWGLSCALGWRAVLRHVEAIRTLVKFIQLGWQGDPQLLVEGQRFNPVLQLLESWAGGRRRRRKEHRGVWA